MQAYLVYRGVLGPVCPRKAIVLDILYFFVSLVERPPEQNHTFIRDISLKNRASYHYQKELLMKLPLDTWLLNGSTTKGLLR